jgi:hypothetical protein
MPGRIPGHLETVPSERHQELVEPRAPGRDCLPNAGKAYAPPRNNGGTLAGQTSIFSQTFPVT